eukprot:g2341.t1
MGRSSRKKGRKGASARPEEERVPLWKIEDDDERRHIAAQRLCEHCKLRNGRMLAIRLAKQAWRKCWDADRCAYYYESTRGTGETVRAKPRMLRGDDAPDDLDLRREQARAMKQPKKRMLEEYLIEREQQRRDEAQRSRKHRDHQNARRAPATTGVPEAPGTVTCAPMDQSATVWWVPPTDDNGSAVVAYLVEHQRLDGGEWKSKGEDKVSDARARLLGADDAVVTKTRVPHLHNGCDYRFRVRAVNAKGAGPPSEPSNTARPQRVLPESWMMCEDPAHPGRYFFYNKLTGQNQWTAPEVDPFFTRTAHFLSLTSQERAGLRALWDEFDPEHDGEIETRQLDALILSLGEIVIDVHRDALLARHCVPRRVPNGAAPVVKWAEFMAMVCDLKHYRRHAPLPRGALLRRAARAWRRSRHDKRRPKADMRSIDHRDSTREQRKRWGAWLEHKDNVLGREFYASSETGQRAWVVPDEVLFYLPRGLARRMRREFSDADMERLRETFRAFDLAHAGRLDGFEARVALESLDGEDEAPLEEDDFTLLFSEVDLEDAGTVEFDQFCVMVRAVQKARRRKPFGLHSLVPRRRKKKGGGRFATAAGSVGETTPAAGAEGGEGRSESDAGAGDGVGDSDDGSGGGSDGDMARGTESDEDSDDLSDSDSEGEELTKPPRVTLPPVAKKPKRLTRWQRRELQRYPHGRACLCGCRSGTLEGKKKKERGAVYVMDDGKWRKQKSQDVDAGDPSLASRMVASPPGTLEHALWDALRRVAPAGASARAVAGSAAAVSLDPPATYTRAARTDKGTSAVYNALAFKSEGLLACAGAITDGSESEGDEGDARGVCTEADRRYRDDDGAHRRLTRRLQRALAPAARDAVRILGCMSPPVPKRPEAQFHAKSKCRKRRYEVVLPLSVLLPAGAAAEADGVALAKAEAHGGAAARAACHVARARVRHEARLELKRLMRRFVGKRPNLSMGVGAAALRGAGAGAGGAHGNGVVVGGGTGTGTAPAEQSRSTGHAVFVSNLSYESKAADLDAHVRSLDPGLAQRTRADVKAREDGRSKGYAVIVLLSQPAVGGGDGTAVPSTGANADADAGASAHAAAVDRLVSLLHQSELHGRSLRARVDKRSANRAKHTSGGADAALSSSTGQIVKAKATCFVVPGDPVAGREWAALSFTASRFFFDQVRKTAGLIVAVMRSRGQAVAVAAAAAAAAAGTEERVVDADADAGAAMAAASPLPDAYIDLCTDGDEVLETPPVPHAAVMLAECNFDTWEASNDTQVRLRYASALGNSVGAVASGDATIQEDGARAPRGVEYRRGFCSSVVHRAAESWRLELRLRNARAEAPGGTGAVTRWAARGGELDTAIARMGRHYAARAAAMRAMRSGACLHAPAPVGATGAGGSASCPWVFRVALEQLRAIDRAGRWPATSKRRRQLIVEGTGGPAAPGCAPSAGDSFAMGHMADDELPARADSTERERGGESEGAGAGEGEGNDKGEGEGEGGDAGGSATADSGRPRAPHANALFPGLLAALQALERMLCGGLLRPPPGGQARSLIVALGEFEGGQLCVEAEASAGGPGGSVPQAVGFQEHDIRYRPLTFNGWTQTHFTRPFRGERYSLVWFSPRGAESWQGDSVARSLRGALLAPCLRSPVPLTIRLNNGVELPTVGLGTYRARGDECTAAVRHALRAGVRLVDTAAVYRNHGAVAAALAQAQARMAAQPNAQAGDAPMSKRPRLPSAATGAATPSTAAATAAVPVQRREIFITTKIMVEASEAEAEAAAHRDVALAVSQLNGNSAAAGSCACAYAEGMTRAIGVSNFTVAHLDALLRAPGVEVVPAVNQVECTPMLPQRALREWCATHGVVVQAYSSLGVGLTRDAVAAGTKATRAVCRNTNLREAPAGSGTAEDDGGAGPQLFDHPVVRRLATARATPGGAAEVLLRWALQQSPPIGVLPKSTHEEHILRNAAVLAAPELSSADLAALDAIECNHHFCWDPTSVL